MLDEKGRLMPSFFIYKYLNMITIETLNIDHTNNQLDIEVRIEDSPYFENMWIDKIVIDT